MRRNIIKRGIKPFNTNKMSLKRFSINSSSVNEENITNDIIEENKQENKTQEVMDTKEKIALANKVLGGTSSIKAKRVRKDKGLIERTESSAIILTEDNKELLND